MERIELYPGVMLNYQEETRFKTEYLSLNLLCPPELFDRAHGMLLGAVLPMGSEKHPTSDRLERALLELYGASLYTHGSSIGETFIQPFSLSFHSDRYLPKGESASEKAYSLLFDCMFSPYLERGAFKKEYVEHQKRNKLALLKAEKDNKPAYAVKKCLQMLCEGEPIAYPQKRLEQDIRRVTPRSLYAYHQRLLKSAPVEIFYFGPQSQKSIVEMLLANLKPLFYPKLPLQKDVASPVKQTLVRQTESINAGQSILCMGFKTPILRGDRRYIAFMLMREMLCDAPVSLIFTHVREKLGLCYFCSSFTLSRKGVYLLSSGIEAKHAIVTEKAILAQIERVKDGDFSEDLLNACKRSLCNALWEMSDSPVSTEGWYLRSILSSEEQTPAELREKICAVTRKEISEAAQSLVPDSFFLLEGRRGRK